MMSHARAGMHQRAEEDYEQEEYDNYDEYDEYEEAVASDAEEDEEREDPKPTKEEQDFLKLREQLKEKFRQKLKKQTASAFGRFSQSQDNTRTVANDKFGSFFGPSKPVIAARVLEESRSIRETQHIVAKVPNSSASNKRGPVSTSNEVKTNANDQRMQNVREVKEVKNKAKALKDTRDYSFLLSDDADLPEEKEEPAPRKVPVPNSGNVVRPAAAGNPRPVPRKVSCLNSDGRSVEASLKSKISASKPARLVANGHERKNSASASQHMQSKIVPKESPTYRSKPTSMEARKGSGVSAGNGYGRPVGRESLPQKISAQVTVSMKPPAKIMNAPSGNKRPLSAKPNSSTQNHYSENRRVTQGPDKLKAAPKQPLPSSKIQPRPSEQIRARGIHGERQKKIHEERPKKRPLRRDDDEDENASAIQLIRNMFGYNPNKYAGRDDEDTSDMEVGFESIMQEEKRSALIARKEDEEQARLIEEEERRERMRKKQKLSRR